MEERYEQLKKALKNLMYNNPAKEIIPSTYARSSANIESYSDWCKAAMPEAR
ncbi:MAG: hypothetical protein ACLRSW_08130 [Christensenellaceae bacterium]